jgi:hypothetical protein
MRLSISVAQTKDGFVPRVVFQNPNGFKTYISDTACTSWKEAWTMGRIMRDGLREQKVV